MGDLIEPGAGVLRLLERVVALVCLDERVLGQVRGELGFAKHSEQIRVDLVVVLGEERFDERRGFVLIPLAAHRTSPGVGIGRAREGVASVGDRSIEDQGCSMREGRTRTESGLRALDGRMTAGIGPRVTPGRSWP